MKKLKTSFHLKVKSPLGPVYVSCSGYDNQFHISTMQYSDGMDNYPAIPIRLGNKRVGISLRIKRESDPSGLKVTVQDTLYWKYNRYPTRASIPRDKHLAFVEWAINYISGTGGRSLDIASLAVLQEKLKQEEWHLKVAKESIQPCQQVVNELKAKIKKEAKRLKVK